MPTQAPQQNPYAVGRPSDKFDPHKFVRYLPPTTTLPPLGDARSDRPTQVVITTKPKRDLMGDTNVQALGLGAWTGIVTAIILAVATAISPFWFIRTAFVQDEIPAPPPPAQEQIIQQPAQSAPQTAGSVDPQNHCAVRNGRIWQLRC